MVTLAAKLEVATSIATPADLIRQRSSGIL